MKLSLFCTCPSNFPKMQLFVGKFYPAICSSFYALLNFRSAITLHLFLPYFHTNLFISISTITRKVTKSPRMATASGEQSGGRGAGGVGAAGIGQRQKEIYKYEAPWPLYSMHWAVRPGDPGIGATSSSSRRGTFRLALGSFLEEYSNRVQIVTLDEATGEFQPMSTFEHNYPPTKILFIPDQVAHFLWLTRCS